MALSGAGESYFSKCHQPLWNSSGWGGWGKVTFRNVINLSEMAFEGRAAGNLLFEMSLTSPGWLSVERVGGKLLFEMSLTSLGWLEMGRLREIYSSKCH